MDLTTPTDDTAADMTDLSLHLSTCLCAACSNARDNDDVARSDTPSDVPTTSAANEASLQEMATYLETGFWSNGTGIRHNLGSTGNDPNNGVLHYNVTGYSTLPYGGGSDSNGVSAARAQLIRDVFQVYEAVLGIQFVETTSTDASLVDFFFSDNRNGAYAGSTRYDDGTIYYSYINVAANWSGSSSTYDDYTLQTIFHEVGHALGLGHQGSYNGFASYADDALFEIDSWQATMMSYFSQSENTAVDASFEFLQTPMAVDWIALDQIYGSLGYGVSNAFLGDTIYGFNTNITADESRIWNAFSSYADRTASTIVDSGGIDTLDISGYDADQTVDLTIQRADQTVQNTSDIGGRIGNLTLAVDTVIENAIGGGGNDTLIGNAADNVLRGGAGDDSLIGQMGDDSFHGDAGFDTVLYNWDFASYSFSLLSNAIQVIGEGIDLVYDTVEQLQFLDGSYSYADVSTLFISDNLAPDARDDSAIVAQDTPLTIAVLDNDGDPDGDPLTITGIDGISVTAAQTVTLGSGASVTLNADGSLAYAQNGAFEALGPGQSEADSFTYTVSDGNGGGDTATVSVSVSGPEISVATPIGQSGTVRVAQSGSDQWHSVTFDATITDAVVVMGPISFNGAQPATTRLRNVTDEGFEFQIDEWNYLDGAHIAETISWLAISEGSHTLATGQTVVASTQSTSTAFDRISFGETLDDAIVLAEVTTYNGSDAVTTRIRNVNETGFEVRLQEEAALGPHLRETVSWIAVEAGTGSGLDVARTADTLTDQVDTFVFNTGFDTAPVLLADMQTTDGPDPATLRLTALDDSGVSLFVEEEQSATPQTGHTHEVAGYVALGEGLIYEDSFLF